MARAVNQVGAHLGPVGSAVSHTLVLLTVPAEATGLGVDAGLDWVKSRFVPNYEVGDEGVTNRRPYLLGSQVGPIFSHFGWDLRVRTFPGIDKYGKVDFQW